jgi:hypothetical protein
VDPGRPADPAKVEAQDGETGVPAGEPEGENDGIVHVAPVQRMRMANDHPTGGTRRVGERPVQGGTAGRPEPDRLFGYHGRMRIAAGAGTVQLTC